MLVGVSCPSLLSDSTALSDAAALDYGLGVGGFRGDEGNGLVGLGGLAAMLRFSHGVVAGMPRAAHAGHYEPKSPHEMAVILQCSRHFYDFASQIAEFQTPGT